MLSAHPITQRIDYFYDLCDQLGFYVIDEANIECHAYFQDMCHDPRYTNAFVERVHPQWLSAIKTIHQYDSMVTG